MLIRTLAVLMAAAVPVSLAHAATWDFVYKGFERTRSDGYNTLTDYAPEATLSGSFSGVDADGNGTLEKAELSDFQFLTFDYLPCSYGYCRIDAFSFAPGGTLSFEIARSSMDPDGYRALSEYTKTGVSHQEYLNNTASTSTYMLTWLPSTTLVVTSPVPEPASYAMLGAGLLLLAAARPSARTRG